jgi:signal peptidase I
MSPAISPGDLVLAEGATFLFREPRRGEIIVFRTTGIAGMPPHEQGQIYVKRLVGLPGDQVRITGGELFVNESQVTLQNEGGSIHYTNFKWSQYLSNGEETVVVPPGHYFVLGDNSPDSADSRIWGFVPGQNVLSRVIFRYGPLSRMGPVR